MVKNFQAAKLARTKSEFIAWPGTKPDFPGQFFSRARPDATGPEMSAQKRRPDNLILNGDRHDQNRFGNLTINEAYNPYRECIQGLANESISILATIENAWQKVKKFVSSADPGILV